ncbi:MAG: MFS transporter [Pseudobdellovibrionaceae bacterium]
MNFSPAAFLVASAFISLFCFGLSDNLRGPLFVELLNHYKLNQTQGSFLWATASFFGFFGSYFYPYISKRTVFETLTPWTLFVMSLAFFFIGLNDLSYIGVLGGSAIFGIVMGVLGVHINVLIHRGIAPNRQAPFYAGLHAMYALSSLVAPLGVVAVAAAGAHWRSSFDCVAFLSLIMACFLGYASRNKQIKTFLAQSAPPETPKMSEQNVQNSDWGFVILFALMLGGYVVAEIMISSRLATYLRQVMGMGLTTSSYLAAVFFLGLFSTRALLFFHPMKFQSFSQLLSSNILSLVFIIGGIAIHPYFLCLTGFTMGLFYPMSMVYLAEKFPSKMSKILSQTQALQALMIMTMHLMMGILADQIGMRLSFLYGLTFLVISTAALLLFERAYQNLYLKEKHV